MACIAILYGGRSGEHEVSCASAASVLTHLPKHHTALLIGIDRKGSWYLQDTPEQIPQALSIESHPQRQLDIRPGRGIVSRDGRALDIRVVLPVLHGSFGEDGAVQGLLECAHLPYAGSGVLGSAVGMDKDVSKRLWVQAGLKVVPWRSLHKGVHNLKDSNLLETIVQELDLPLFVKPANAGSSVGIRRVHTTIDIKEAIEHAWTYDRKVLVERAVAGREIECSVMGYASPTAFPLGEVIPAKKHGFYDYDAKYIDPDGALLHVPAELPQEAAAEIRESAVRAYRAVEAKGFSRVDFLMDSSTGEIFINEINTIPGMTPISLFPRMTAAGGINFSMMLETLIEGALAEWEYREGRSYIFQE